MAAHFEVFAERQPWEEQQVESPTHDPLELSPLELALQRTRSPTSPTFAPRSPTSPTSPQQLSRRLSAGDPDSPPPAWKRRPSVSQRSALSSSSQGTEHSSSLANSPPFQPQQLPPQRRHPPNLVMTRAGVAQRILRENEPPHLRVPVPPNGRGPPGSYRRRAATTSSNRSSLNSQDGGLTSEELWNMEDDAPDMSNPMRPASERPLDTVNRMSQRLDQPAFGMGLEVLWPTAPPDADYIPPPKTKSLTNMTSMKRRSGTLRKRNSQAGSMNAPYQDSITPSHSKDALSSAHSSTTSLSMPINKSQASLNTRPTSYSYSLDLLSTLMPREGGYAVAAQIGYSSHTSSPVDDRRSYPTHPPNTYRGPRGPAAKSSGMRWSVDPDEFAPPSGPGRHSPATTVSSLGDDNDNSTPPTPQYTSAPVAPSPLSQQTTAAEMVNGAPSPVPQRREAAVPLPVVPAAAAAANGTSPTRTKTKKERKAEEKAAKAQAKRLAVEKAEAEAKAKAEAKRAEAQAKIEAAKKDKELKAQAAAQAKAEAARKKEEEKARSKTKSVKRVPSFRRKSQILTGAPPAVPQSQVPPVPATQQRVVSAPVGSTAAPVAAAAAAAAAPLVIPQRSTSAAPRPQASAPAPAPVAPTQTLTVSPPTATPGATRAADPVASASAPAAQALAVAPPSAAAPAPAPAPVSTPAQSPARAPAAPAAVRTAAPAAAPAASPRAPAPEASVTAPVAAVAAAVPAAIAAASAAPSSPPRAPTQAPSSPPRTPAQAPVSPPRTPAKDTPQRAPQAAAVAPVPAPAPAPRPVQQAPVAGPQRPPAQAPVAGPQRPAVQAPVAGPVRPGPVPVSAPAARPQPAPPAPSRAPPAIVVPSISSSSSDSRGTPSPSISGSTVRASNASQASAAPSKKGLFSSLKKRFSISALDSSSTVQSRPRPKSVILSQSSDKHKEKALPSVPVIAHQQEQRRGPAPSQTSLPPPIVVPPRNSSLASSSPSHSTQDTDGSGECTSSLSNPSSVIVTPTASMAANSMGSLFDMRPSAVRKGSDSATSAAASNMTDHGELEKAPAAPIPSAVAAH